MIENNANNFASFMRLCTYLVRVLKYPCHWIGIVLDDIVKGCLSGSFKSQAEFRTLSPPTSVNSIKKSFKNINLSPFRVEIISQVQLWSSKYTSFLKPLEALPILKNIQTKKYILILNMFERAEYKLEINGIRGCGIGDNPSTAKRMCLGLILSNEIIETNNIRSEIFSKRYQLLSCINFNCNLKDQKNHSLEFYMDTESYKKYSSLYITLIRTDTWQKVGSHDKTSQFCLRDARLLN